MDTSKNPPVVLHLDDPLELLAYLPYRLGFWPEESAVFFSLRSGTDADSRRWQPGLVARVDLSDLGDESRAQGGALRQEMLGHLRDDGAEVVFLVVYTAEPVSIDAGTGPASATVQWWLRHGIGADTGRIWVVTGETYRCLQCRTEPCCPAIGHPLAKISQSRIGAEMVYHGLSYAPSREELLHHPQVSGQVRTAAVRAAARWRRRRPLAGPGRRPWLTNLATRWDRVLSARTPAAQVPASHLGALLVGLEEAGVRDAVLLAAVTGHRVATMLGEDSASLLAKVFSPDGPVPRPEQLAYLTDLLHHLVAVCARGRAAGIWATLAWLAWYQGNGARADLCLHECLGEDPGHRLGLLIRRAVDHGIPPGWARTTAVA